MNIKTATIPSRDGSLHSCLLIEAADPASGLPCVYTAVMNGESEVGAVRFRFPVMYLLTVPFDWSKIFDQVIAQLQSQQLVDQVLSNPGEIHEATFITA